MRGVMVWWRRLHSGVDTRQDGHRRVHWGPCEQVEGKERLCDVVEKEMKVRRRCSLDQEDGGGAPSMQWRSGGWRSAPVAPRGTPSCGPSAGPAHRDRGAVGRPIDGGPR
jgi:hypothetical protein